MITATHHTAISVVDLAAAKRFYALLGLSESARAELSDGTTLVLLHGSGGMVELIWPQTTRKTAPVPLERDLETTGTKHIAFQSDDLDAEFALLGADGFPVAVGPSPSPYGLRFAFVTDPSGNWIELLGY
ncbi:VOC family protein [Fertoebacter nigrum]|uniref:VOC family protein n=1 Tax=Fertoeibacter niger TaxID=2656921 RepID=A0A8X8GWV8_9RHOB|nr:VOC family protein [Fertoeibacter niger]